MRKAKIKISEIAVSRRPTERTQLMKAVIVTESTNLEIKNVDHGMLGLSKNHQQVLVFILITILTETRDTAPIR